MCWSTNPNPTINGNHTSDGTNNGSLSNTLEGLNPNTTYYVRAYVVSDNGLIYGNEESFTTLEGGGSGNAQNGTINGLFTINANGDQVYFSQGNLQYQASTNTWRFAENQWDYIGYANSNISPTYDGWIDLLGWGTSGFNHGAACYQPWSTSENYYDYYAYGLSNSNLNDQTGQADWGYNAISNGGNQENLWRTLTMQEWHYLIKTRNTPSGIRWAVAKVNNASSI